MNWLHILPEGLETCNLGVADNQEAGMPDGQSDTDLDTDLDTEIVRRVVEIDVAIDELWRMISDPEELATWLGDDVDLDVSPGARGRITDDDEHYDVEVDEVEHGERVVWRWRPADDDGSATSRVELVVAPAPRGGTLTIIETRPAPPVAAMSTGTMSTGTMSTAVTSDAVRWEVRSALVSLRSGLCVVA
jgi:uncharacterized protein YndB with AHSA1/START domain